MWNIGDNELIDDSSSRELLILRRPTVLDAVSGDPLKSALPGTGRNGGLKSALFLPDDRALFAAGTSKSGAEYQLIVWPAHPGKADPSWGNPNNSQ